MRVLYLLLLLPMAAAWQLDSNTETAADRLIAVCDRCDGDRIADVERLIHDRFPIFLNPTAALLKPNTTGKANKKPPTSAEDDDSEWDIIGAAERACEAIKSWTNVGFSRPCQQGLKDAVCSVAELVQAVRTSCSPETGTEAECRRCTIEKSARTGRSLWVIKLLDSMGKLPAGLTEGNFLWLGDYEQCTQLTAPIEMPNERARQFNGQYCKANLGLPQTKQKAASMSCSSDSSVDTNGCVPAEKTLFIQYGICAPSTCSADELTALVRKFVPMCHSFVECSHEHESELAVDTAFYLCLLSIFLAVVGGGTLVDLFVCRPELKAIEKDRIKRKLLAQPGDSVSDQLYAKSPKNEAEYYTGLDLPMRLLVACSLYSNGKQALSTRRRPESIGSLDGLRLFSMAWLIYGSAYHSAICYLRNVTFAGENAASLWYQSLNNVTVAIDTFFVISGCIVSFNWLKKVQKGKTFEITGYKSWLGFYLHRYFRFTPMYIIIIAFTVTVFPYLAAGPMWYGQNFDVVKNCRTNWWQNLLYVNNFFDNKENCMGWTWYLANDMQFFWLTPPLLLLLNS
uniref:Nose resistant-to-fluoxetine protein N-terminal domain-containing protein n=1 Tax=Plectus sambesii TaxID=2011161 RepID=A0A914XME0_9BILA